MEEYGMEPKRVINRVGLALFYMALAVLASSIIIEIFVYFYARQIFESDWYQFAVTAVTVVGIGFPVFSIAVKKIPDSEHNGIVKLRTSEFVVLFFISVAAMYLTNYLGVFVNFVIAIIKGEEIINPLVEVVLESNIMITFLYGAIIAPIVEELIFRKLLLNKVRRFGDLPAILLTGFAFGLFHMNLSQFFYATALGFIFAYITLKTNTVKYAILLHIMINSIGVLIAPLVIRNENNLLLLALMGLWVICSITIGCVFFILNIKKIKFEKAYMLVEKKSIFILNPGTILFILLCLVLTVIRL